MHIPRLPSASFLLFHLHRDIFVSSSFRRFVFFCHLLLYVFFLFLSFSTSLFNYQSRFAVGSYFEVFFKATQTWRPAKVINQRYDALGLQIEARISLFNCVLWFLGVD